MASQGIHQIHMLERPRVKVVGQQANVLGEGDGLSLYCRESLEQLAAALQPGQPLASLIAIEMAASC